MYELLAQKILNELKLKVGVDVNEYTIPWIAKTIKDEVNSIPMDAEVILPSETLSCEQDAEYGRAIKEKLKSLETENIPADM